MINPPNRSRGVWHSPQCPGPSTRYRPRRCLQRFEILWIGFNGCIDGVCKRCEMLVEPITISPDRLFGLSIVSGIAAIRKMVAEVAGSVRPRLEAFHHHCSVEFLFALEHLAHRLGSVANAFHYLVTHFLGVSPAHAWGKEISSARMLKINKTRIIFLPLNL
jgi:hypothetical protein